MPSHCSATCSRSDFGSMESPPGAPGRLDEKGCRLGPSANRLGHDPRGSARSSGSILACAQAACMLRVVSLKIIPTRTSVSARGAYNIEGTPCRSISGGTFFWIDPAEDLAAVLMTQMPGATRAYYRRPSSSWSIRPSRTARKTVSSCNDDMLPVTLSSGNRSTRCLPAPEARTS